MKKRRVPWLFIGSVIGVCQALFVLGGLWLLNVFPSPIFVGGAGVGIVLAMVLVVLTGAACGYFQFREPRDR